MKFINKLFIIALVLASFTACENTELDLLTDPNNVAPENASLNDLYNNIQLTFGTSVYPGLQGSPGAMARMYFAGSYTYQAEITDATFNGLWTTVYANLFPDVDALVSIAEANNFDVHAGSAKLMKAYAMVGLVDLFGDVPFSEAGQGTDIISPSADSGQDIYNAATALIDEAIAQLTGTNAAAPSYETFYGGDPDGWIKFGNSLKLKMALNTGDAATINSLVAGGNLITDQSEDFTFKYGSTRTNPTSRHPWYQSHYELGDGAYMATYYMWLLNGEKLDVDGTPIIDPRTNYYFYRKIPDAEAGDQTEYSCEYSIFPTIEDRPPHFEAVDPRMPYCIILGTGYWGRDHLNGQGIPPDGPLRTSYGLYPAGGQFDDQTYQDTRKSGTTGGLGQGIWPIMTASFVDFMRAEAALTLGTSDDARTMLESGIRASFAKVQSFESLVPDVLARTFVDPRTGENVSIRQRDAITSAKLESYVGKVLALYDAATTDDERLDIIIKEYMIAAWGNGIEAYNMYRRTGKPGNIQPSLQPASGDFPRSFLLPANHVTRNANANQRSFTDRVFFDDGSTTLY